MICDVLSCMTPTYAGLSECEYVVTVGSYRDLDFEDQKPCEQAYAKDIFYIDRRAKGWRPVQRPDDSVDMVAAWHEKGVNHRIEDDRCVRDIPTTKWVIRLQLMKDFHEFASKFNARIHLRPGLIVIQDEE